MGVYLNPPTKEFTDRIAKKTFVDQTDLLAVVADKINDADHKYIAVSRPRRFGKTVDANMIIAFLEKNGDPAQFDGLKIASHKKVCETHRGKYNVFFLDMSKNLIRADDIKGQIDYLEKLMLRELQDAFPDLDFSLYKFLNDMLAYACSVKKEQFIFIVDEWDAPLRLLRDRQEDQKRYLSWLNDLFKNQGYLALAYMTGILPIKKYGDDSLMNMFDEYSMTDPGVFAPYMGFTGEDVEDLCKRHGEAIDDYKAWYDGYLMTMQRKSKDGILCDDGIRRVFTSFHIYNPKSIAKAFSDGDIQDYWDRTGQFAALKDYIDTDRLGVRTAILELMEGGRKEINIRTFANDATRFKSGDDVLTMLVHLGYLTYDAKTKEAYIPNHELTLEFKDAMENASAEFAWLMGILRKSFSLLEATWRKDSDAVAKAVDEAHGHVCAPKDYNRELALLITIEFAYYAARPYYTMFPEAPTGLGYADVMFVPVKPDHPAMVIELKWDKGVKSAIDQIRDKRYPARLENYAGNILCIGISYEKTDSENPEYKKHTCVIEQM